MSMHTRVRSKRSWWLKKMPHFSVILVWKFTSGSMNFTNATSLKNKIHALNKGLLHTETVIHYIRTLNSARWLLTLWTITVETKQLFLLHCPHTVLRSHTHTHTHTHFMYACGTLTTHPYCQCHLNQCLRDQCLLQAVTLHPYRPTVL